MNFINNEAIQLLSIVNSLSLSHQNFISNNKSNQIKGIHIQDDFQFNSSIFGKS